MTQYVWLSLLGFAIGTYGTLIGAGGGFVLVPILLILYPEESPEIITSMSLAVVFFNAFSGSWAYARMKTIDYKSGLIFAIASVPGAILGAWSTAFIPRQIFDAILGGLMIAGAIFLYFNTEKKHASLRKKMRFSMTREVVDKAGKKHRFTYNPVIGIVISAFIGYVSSFLGIGGGIVHVPVLVHLLNFPVHVATATSHFILAIMALTGTIVHISTGVFIHGVRRTVAITIGVLIGAQLGAFLSHRMRSNWIIRSLAIALAFVGIRVLMMAF